MRRLIRNEVRKAWENSHLLDLPGTIRMMIDVYLSAPNTNCRTVKEINLGACMDFAEDVIEKCGGATNDLYLLDTGHFYDDDVNGDHQYPNVIQTVHGGVWCKESLDEYGYPPDPENTHIGIHQWIFYKGKHYDAEAPDGVDSPWDLPFFDRQIKGIDPYLNEMEDGDYEDDEEEDFSDLKDEAYLKTLFPLFVQAAQKVYDEWEQDEDGVDEVLGTGGICQDIAEGICSVMSEHGIDCTSVSQQVGEQHVYSMCKLQNGVYEVDIPPYSYESGGGYTWRKLPNIKFDDSYLVVSRVSSDPNDFEQYTQEW